MKAAIGVSPHNAHRYDESIELALRDTAAGSKKVVAAIGSCGIDNVTDDVQIEAFARQVALAKEFDLALIVKAPSCEGRAFEIVCEQGMPFGRVLLRAARCDAATLAPWIEAGSYVSLSGAQANDCLALSTLVETLPTDRVLVESGAPSAQLERLAGEPPRADQVVFVADAIISTVSAAQLTANFEALFM